MILDQPVSSELCLRLRRWKGVHRVITLMAIAALFCLTNIVSVSSAIAAQLQSAASTQAQALPSDTHVDGRLSVRAKAGLVLAGTTAQVRLGADEAVCLATWTGENRVVETIRRMGRDIAPWRIEHIVILAAVMSLGVVENSRWRGVPWSEHGGPKAAGSGAVARAPPAFRDNLPGLAV